MVAVADGVVYLQGQGQARAASALAEAAQRPSVSSYWRRNCSQLSACSVQRLEKLPLPAWNTVKQGRIRR